MEEIASQYADTEKAIREATHTEQIPPLLEKLAKQKNIDTEIARDYAELRESIIQSSQVSDASMGELVRMHATLVDMARGINKAIPLAERACQDQATGLGQCTYQ